MADAPLNPEERDLLAAELALGVLDGADRALALRLQMSDGVFREAVSAWQERFEPLLQSYLEVEAPDLWPLIEQRLSPEREGAAQDDIVSRIEGRLRIWRMSALAAGALAAGLATFMLLRAPTAPSIGSRPAIAQLSPPIVARLGEGDNAHQFLASYDAPSGALHIRALRMPPSDLTPELWVIPADNVPRSLGLVTARGSMVVTVQPAIRALLKDGATLAVSMEKREGAPHTAPSSTPVAAGQLQAL